MRFLFKKTIGGKRIGSITTLLVHVNMKDMEVFHYYANLLLEYFIDGHLNSSLERANYFG